MGILVVTALLCEGDGGEAGHSGMCGVDEREGVKKAKGASSWRGNRGQGGGVRAVRSMSTGLSLFVVRVRVRDALLRV